TQRARRALVGGGDPVGRRTGWAHTASLATLTPDENTMLTLYRQLDPLIKLQAQKWIERRVRNKTDEEQDTKSVRQSKRA
ncbi:MAG: hypothetical protein ABF809_02800, partial [Gluconobacter potus]